MKRSPTLPPEFPLASQFLRSLAHHPLTIRTFRHLLRFSKLILSLWARFLGYLEPPVSAVSPSRLSINSLPRSIWLCFPSPQSTFHTITWILYLVLGLEFSVFSPTWHCNTAVFFPTPWAVCPTVQHSTVPSFKLSIQIQSQCSISRLHNDSVLHHCPASKLYIQSLSHDHSRLNTSSHFPFQLSIHTFSHHPSLIPVAL